MKKIFLTVLSAFLLCVVNAQQSSYAPAESKTMTTAEANKLNGVAQPTINGKPYSQYKAEQEALKRQKQATKPASTINADIVGVNAADAKPAPGYKKPEPKVTEKAIVKTATPAALPVPEGLQLGTESTGAQQNAIVQQKQLVVPAAHSNPSQSSIDKMPDAYKTPVIKDANKSSGNETIEAKPAVISSSVVSTDTKKASPTPEVPAQFRLPATAQTWTGRNVEASQVSNNSDPAQVANAQVAVTDMNAYKAQQTAGQKATTADVIAKPQTVDAAVVTTKEVKTAPAPQVPEQFKLSAESWNIGAPAAQQASVVKSDPAQSMDTKISSEQFKAPTMDRTNKQSGDEGKNQEAKPQVKKVDAALVNNAASKQADPTGLAFGNNGTAAPASNPQAEVSIKGTSLDPAAKAVTPARTQATGQEGGGNPTPVPANVVKAPAKDKEAAPAPALPSNMSNPAGNNGAAGNSPAGSTAQVVPVETSKQGTEKPASKE